jgi:hypothetical protein
LGNSNYSFSNVFINPKTLSDLDSKIVEQVAYNDKVEADRLAKIEADKLAKIEADKLAKIEAGRLAQEETDRLAREEALLASQESSNGSQEPYQENQTNTASETTASSSASGGSYSGYVSEGIEEGVVCEDYGYDTDSGVAWTKAKEISSDAHGTGWGEDEVFIGNQLCHRGYYYMKSEDIWNQSEWIYI